jgi:hypothetical protein
MNTGLPSGSPLDWVESRLPSAVRTVCFKIVPCRVRAAAPAPVAASLPACRRRAGNGREGRRRAISMVDFQRLRRSSDLVSAPLLAASIFLDALNVFLFFLRIFSRGD